MFVETGDGHTIGEIHQRWHLYKRNYDLYLEKKQFAAITGTFLAWEFELKNSQGGNKLENAISKVQANRFVGFCVQQWPLMIFVW